MKNKIGFLLFKSKMITETQKLALKKFQKGENLFLTGAAGSGKTTLIRRMHEDAISRKKKIQVTALTGCAAILLKCCARTIHSFAGIGLGTGEFQDVVKRVRLNPSRVKTWKSINILIVDEISMMSKRLLELLDVVARDIRRTDKPFGGIQLILSGDFYQIRPVGRPEEPGSQEFCFESPLWNRLFSPSQHVVLTTIFRQKDPEYTHILTQIRNGCLDDAGEEKLRGILNKKTGTDQPIRPIQLFPTRRQADIVNQREFSVLDPSTEKVFSMENNCPDKQLQKELEFLKKNVLCEETIRLRKGAQVMLIVNKTFQDIFLCNGSQGTIQSFSSMGNPVVRFQNGFITEIPPHEWRSETNPDVVISQIPLILAWAVTIHKSQGATLEMAEIDVGRSIFECGQMYVALSRIKDMQGLFLKSFDRNSLRVDPKVQQFYQQLTT